MPAKRSERNYRGATATSRRRRPHGTASSNDGPDHRTHAGSLTSQLSELIQRFFELLAMIKMFHWKTHQYSAHKITDELHAKLSTDMDQLIEVFMGRVGPLVSRRPMAPKYRAMNVREVADVPRLCHRLTEFRTYLLSLSDRTVFHAGAGSSAAAWNDVWNIRDQTTSTIDQALYLLRI